MDLLKKLFGGVALFLVMVLGFGVIASVFILFIALLTGGVATALAWSAQNIVTALVVNVSLLLLFFYVVRRPKFRAALREYWKQIHLP